MDSRKSDREDADSCLARVYYFLSDLIQSVYKLTLVVIFLCLCLLLGAIIGLLALIPSYGLFIWIVFRVRLNWRTNHH
jgi:hypothetical protein